MMKFVATIRAVGQINRRGNWKSSAASFSGPRSSSGGGGGLRQIYAAARDDRPNNSLPSAIVASTILASAILYQENNRTKYYTADAECSALPTQPSGVAAVDNITSFAKPVEDIKSVYKLGDIIGEGGFGQVYYATRIEDGKPVALKCIPKEWTLDEEFKREVGVLQKLNIENGGHPHICKMFSIHEGKDEYWMAMEAIMGGELFEHLIEEGAYSEAKAAVFLRQFAEALSFMHKAGVVHGDLKPENLLLSDNEEAELKLVDFGCSVIVRNCEKDQLPSGTGTLFYDPPEKIINQSPPSYTSDVWAAGCILYIILTGTHPFDKSGCATDEEVAETVTSVATSVEKLNDLVFDERASNLSESAINLLRSMLHPDPNLRATCDTVRRNRWVQGLTASWNILEGSDGKLERYWQKEFKSNIMKKFGCVSDEQLKQVYKQIDEDGNGSIDLDELTKVLKDSGAKPKDIQSIFNAINLDNDSGISFDEFKAVMRTELPAQFYRSKFRDIVAKEIQCEGGDNGKMTEPLKAAARRLFSSIDLDNNGSLDCHELRLLMRKLGVDENEISLLVASVDLNQDGSLDFDEFSKVLFGATRSKIV